MTTSTGISWADRTWIPFAGCTHISPGCDGCYAARDANGRLSGHPLYAGLTDTDGRFTGVINLAPERLHEPLRWKPRTRVFINSQSDLFHPNLPSDYLVEVLGVMAAARDVTFQVLTKRPKDMKRRLTNDAFLDEVDTARLSHSNPTSPLFGIDPDWPRPNWWLGTSIENPDYLWRARVLRETPAALRWLSLEPLLAPLEDLGTYLACHCGHPRRDHMHSAGPAGMCSNCLACNGWDGIDWIVVGGESGPRARPMDPGWARTIRDLCADHEVPFHFKQWGRWIPYEPTAQPPFWLGQDGIEEDGHVFPGDLSEGRPTYGWWAPPWADGLDDRGPADPIVFRSYGGGKAPKPATLDGIAHLEYPQCVPSEASSS